VRSKDRLKDNWQFYFLSPQMEIFKSNKAVLDYISSQSDTYTQEDFDKVKTWIEDEQRARRGENYTWNEDKSLPDGWKMRRVVTNSNNIREFFLTPDGDHIAGRRKAIEVMKDRGIYDQKIIAKMVKEMKRVSEKNHKKSTLGKKQSEDDQDGDGWGPGEIPAGSSQDWVEDSNDPNDDYYQDNQEIGEEEEDEEEEIDFSQMYPADGPMSDSVDNIDMKDLIPEYEPVEITPVEAGQDDYSNDEDEDEDGFNDAEEITDDMLDNDQSDASIRVEDIKIEPDINMALLHQYM